MRGPAASGQCQAKRKGQPWSVIGFGGGRSDKMFCTRCEAANKWMTVGHIMFLFDRLTGYFMLWGNHAGQLRDVYRNGLGTKGFVDVIRWNRFKDVEGIKDTTVNFHFFMFCSLRSFWKFRGISDTINLNTRAVRLQSCFDFDKPHPERSSISQKVLKMF